jgi:hypothetical protein
VRPRRSRRFWLGSAPGTDLAAHAYQRTVFLEHGFTLWNNFWYAGRYSFISYSILYYPLAALLGIRLLAVATIATAALAFAVVLGHEFGPAARRSSRTFAVVWAGIVLSAAFPFALGVALALLALWAPGRPAVALRSRRCPDPRRQPACVPAAHARARRDRNRSTSQSPRADRRRACGHDDRRRRSLSSARVPGRRPLSVSRASEDGVRLALARPGRYRLAIRYSAYWQAHGAYVGRGKDGMIIVTTRRVGVVDLDFDVNAGRLIASLEGERYRGCSQ